jgi:autotransporter-associated beta strand protein
MKNFVPHTQEKTSSQQSRLLGLTAGALALATVSASAASATWSASPTNGFWEASGAENNWSTGAGTFPGATVGTANTDAATFLTSSSTNILINASTSNALALNIGSIVFGASGAAPSSFTIGTLGGNALSLSNSGTIVLSSGITGSNITQTINAPLVLAGAGYTIRNDSSTVSNTLQIAGTISGSSGATSLTLRGGNSGTNTVSGLISNGGASSLALNKFDGATWILTNRANSYSGQTTVNGGILRAVDSSTYGSGNLTMTGGGALGTGQVTINGGQLQLRVNGDNTSASQTLTYANSSIFANNSATSTVDLDRASGATAANKTLAFAAGSVARGGTLTVTSANGYRLQLNNMNISGSGDGSYTFNPTTGRVLLSGTFNNNTNSSTATAILGGTSAGNEVSASLINGVGTARILAVTKSGASTWTLSSSNSYSGATVVTAGTLLVSGTHTGGGAYSVTGGTFGGSGSITAASLTASAGTKLTAGGDGILSNTFTLSLAGGMDLSAASNNTGAYLFDLAGVSASDKITLTTGTLNVGTLDFADFTFNALSGFGAGTYVLFDAASAISGSIGTASGTIGGLSATLSIDSLNNNVVLTVVPEPGAAALLGAALSGLFFVRRNRRNVGN